MRSYVLTVMSLDVDSFADGKLRARAFHRQKHQRLRIHKQKVMVILKFHGNTKQIIKNDQKNIFMIPIPMRAAIIIIDDDEF